MNLGNALAFPPSAGSALLVLGKNGIRRHNNFSFAAPAAQNADAPCLPDITPARPSQRGRGEKEPRALPHAPCFLKLRRSVAPSRAGRIFPPPARPFCARRLPEPPPTQGVRTGLLVRTPPGAPCRAHTRPRSSIRKRRRGRWWRRTRTFFLRPDAPSVA